MLIILVEVSSSLSSSATDCSHSATYMLLILVEVSVKVTCQSTTATDCCHRATSMVLILVEVSVKVQSQPAATELPPC